MLQAGRRGEGLERWKSACWLWRAPIIMGARPQIMGGALIFERAPIIMGARPHLVGGLVISSFSSCS
jgi:hypothetical protein